MQNILIAESSEEVQLILNEISLIDKAGIEVNPEIWCIVGKTTDNAESAHADINREGKELSLMNAIEKARKHDMRKYKTCEIQDKYGVAKTGQNNGPIFCALQSVKRHDKKRTLKQKSTSNKTKRIKSNSTEKHLLELVQQISLEERKLEIEERKERLRETKLLNYEKARQLGIKKELGYDE
ncbi:44520_t:CDS:2 [Gigaspora margarita]|uniref:44520_t:CDS:1 n=1 Tax=Gigaspora margarita TaxID=4874 RepID=A0ABN7V506_GIGMA|nr:44520_t:CDS:2 [Gigaspora margarita]